MTKQEERYYYFDEEARTIWHTTDEDAEVGFLEFLGSSFNPNIRMAVQGFTTKLPWNNGYTIKELP